MKDQILITGTVLSAGENHLDKYEYLARLCSNHSENIKSPLDTMEFKGMAREKYQRAIKLVDESAVIVADVSTPSTGQGMELQHAEATGKPIAIIYKEGNKVSSLIDGLENVKIKISYADIKEVESRLSFFLQQELGQKESVR